MGPDDETTDADAWDTAQPDRASRTGGRTDTSSWLGDAGEGPSETHRENQADWVSEVFDFEDGEEASGPAEWDWGDVDRALG